MAGQRWRREEKEGEGRQEEIALLCGMWDIGHKERATRTSNPALREVVRRSRLVIEISVAEVRDLGGGLMDPALVIQVLPPDTAYLASHQFLTE